MPLMLVINELHV